MIDPDEAPLVEPAFELVLPVWQAVGALEENRRLTPLGWWGCRGRWPGRGTTTSTARPHAEPLRGSPACAALRGLQARQSRGSPTAGRRVGPGHELQVRWPSSPIVLCEALQRIGLAAQSPAENEATDDTTPTPSVAEIRHCARANGMAVSGRGPLRPEIHQSWRDAHPS